MGTSLAVRWLGLRTSTTGTQVRSLVSELRSHMLSGAAKKKGKDSGRESLPTPGRLPQGPQSQLCRLYRAPAGQPRWAVLPHDGQGDNRPLPSVSQAHHLSASFTDLAGIPGSSLSTSLQEHCPGQPSDVRGGCLDVGALCPGFQTWLHSAPLQLCDLGQVVCPFWASPFIFTARLYPSVIHQALQFCWSLGASKKLEASLLHSKARRWI